jgi:hypothetical protein
MQWRFINPVGIAFFGVVITVFIFISLLMATGLAESGYEELSIVELFKGYVGAYSCFFHPSSLRGWRGDPAPSIGTAIILTILIIGYVLSAQPDKIKLRKIGSTVGVVTTVIWVMYSILISAISSVS